MAQKRTILIIDDCPEDRETYRRYLLQDDLYTYTILEAEYGENGLELCQLLKPDAILLDFGLPDIDGIEFLGELKTQPGKLEIPVVMLTGQGNEAIAVQAMKSGAADYLIKGNTTSENLRLAIHNIFERDRLRWQLEQSEQRFRTSIENMLDCFGIYKSVRDESGKIVDFLIEYVNAAACENNRMTQAEQIGKRLLEILPSHRDGLFDEYCQVVETGKPLVKEAVIYSDIYHNQYLTRAFDIRIAKLGDGFVASWRDITERKSAEASLQLLESVVVNANDAVVVTAIAPLDDPGPRIMFVNQAFTRMTGYSTDEAIGKSPRFLQGPKTDRVELNRIRAALQAKQPVQAELINYHKNGTEFWVEISITPVAANGEYTHFVSIQRNITERKQAEAALRDSQRFIQQIAYTIPDILYIHDLRERKNVYVNRQIAQVLGYSPEAIGEMGSAVLQCLMHPEDFARLPQHFKKFDSAGDGEIVEFEYRMQDSNGEWRWLYSRETLFTRTADGLPHQILGIASDITQNKQAKAALQRYADFFQHNELGQVIGSSDGQTLELMNPAFARMHGYSIEEMQGFPIIDLFPPECQAEVPEYIRLANEKGHYTFESKHIRKDGTVFPVCIDMTAIKDQDGNLLYRIVSVQDITERQRIESERLQLLADEQVARAEAEAANQAKDQFVAMVSHDLRSPLNSILGWANLARKSPKNEATVTRALETIERSGKAQAKLLEDLLDISRMIQGKMQLQLSQIGLVSLIESAINTAYPTASDKGIQLFVLHTRHSTPLIVSGDPNRLQQVLGNLLSNAIKFTPAGGRIDVQLSVVIGDRNEQLPFTSYAQIQVSDTGKGINPEFLPLVFKRFHQADGMNKQMGLGLGLAIAHHLVELHGGTIHAESLGEGHGATFTIKLPLEG